MAQRSIKVANFINSAFKEFSLYDNVRSIPLLVDGLKPAQRKVLYGLQQRGESAGEIQVERAAAQIAAVTDYHHGTASLEATMVGMAVSYPGTNNLNLLVPSGQFGSRLTKEAAAGRYIFTKLHENFRKVCKPEDDAILEHHEVDGERIEPKYYLPILPLVLVNGAQGTGTGHACLIMSYSPERVRDACLKVLAGRKLRRQDLVPWFKGFKGTVEVNPETDQVVITGKLEVVNSTTIRVTELPIGTYLDQYKAHLHALEDEGVIKDYEDRSTEEGFDFLITCPRATTQLSPAALYQRFKLVARDTENFTLWNEAGVLERFESPMQIVERFVQWRLLKYEERRQHLIKLCQEQVRWLSERLRFLEFYLANTAEFKNRPRADLVAFLLQHKFEAYERLLQLPMWSLTRDRLEQLREEIVAQQLRLAELEATTAEELYRRELKEFCP